MSVVAAAAAGALLFWNPLDPGTGYVDKAGNSAERAEGGATAGAAINDQRRLRAFDIVVKALQLGENVDQAVERIERANSEAASMAAARSLLARNLDPKSMFAGFAAAQGDFRDRAVVISLPSQVIFEGSDPHRMSQRGRDAIRRVADSLAQLGDDFGIVVTGHATPAGLPGKLDPWIVSTSQAGAVAAELTRRGINGKNIEATGVSDSRPLYPARRPDGGIDRDGARHNNRIDIALRASRKRQG